LNALLEVADRDFASLNDGICYQATRSEAKLNRIEYSEAAWSEFAWPNVAALDQSRG